MEVLLANPRGFCAGVDRAIDIVERALRAVRRADLRAPRGRAQQVRGRRPARQGRGVRRGTRRGAGRQHGDLQRPRRVARRCGARPRRAACKVFDATCPLVTKVHIEVAKMRAQGREIVMIGHAGHPEVEGTMGQATSGMYLVETVADVDAARGRRRRTSSPTSPRPRCRWTTPRPSSPRCKRALSRHRRAEEGRHLLRHAEPPGRGEVHGAAVRRGDRGRLAQQLQLQPPARSGADPGRGGLHGRQRGRTAIRNGCTARSRVGVTAGASAPEVLVKEVIARLQALGAKRVSQLQGKEEGVTFPLPKGLANGASAEH